MTFFDGKNFFMKIITLHSKLNLKFIDVRCWRQTVKFNCKYLQAACILSNTRNRVFQSMLTEWNQRAKIKFQSG